MIDRVNLSANERQIWLVAFAQATAGQSQQELGPAQWLRRSQNCAQSADGAVMRYRELLPGDKPREPSR